MAERKKYKLRNGELELVQALGRRGGRKNTERQQLARRLNLYRALAKRNPTSVKIAVRIRQLEKEMASNGNG